MSNENYRSILACLAPYLCSDDDTVFWHEAISVIISDIEAQISDHSPRNKIALRIGACSHWLRPHQTRWKAAGGFAWPVGYGGVRHSRKGTPELDWSITFVRNAVTEKWEPSDRPETKDTLLCRVALPTRTKRHNQAAVHTNWEPGNPSNPKLTSTRFYGFRREAATWACVASTDDD
ncbi:MAG: hypothetical protein AAFN05_00035 [Pseudomonadota bacterium]